MIAEIIARLQSQVPTLKLVAGAAEFQAASETNPLATPAAYVLRMAENGGKSLTAAQVTQRVAAEIGIVIVVRNVADPTGAAAGADLETLRIAVRAALLGWAPPGCDRLEFAAGGLLAFRDGHIWWQDSYHSAYTINS